MDKNTFWFKIENRSQYLQPIQKLHPSNPKYLDYWKDIKKKIIEGLWGKESQGYRYCPGTIFFYGNLYTILDTDKRQKTRIPVRPTIRTVEWVRAYNYLCMQGFSGFFEDDEYSCDEALVSDYLYNMLAVSSDSSAKERWDSIHTKKGDKKQYIPSLEYCRKLFPKPMGKVLYFNDAKDIVELGARGGGKSYWYSMLVCRELIIDGCKYYDPEYKPQITVAIGSSNTDKSEDLAQKVKDGMDALAEDNTLGAYGTFGDSDYTPSPIFKNMIGDISANNKANAYRHVYKVKNNGELLEKGSKSSMVHFSYSPQKKNGSEAAVGTRLNLNILEEAGVMPNLLEVVAASKYCHMTDDMKFSSMCIIGTSGNMETVQGVKKMFENPKIYNCLEFDNFYEEGKGKIGFFLPAYMVDGNFLDEDGNTDIDRAKAHYEKLLSEQTADSINDFKMSKPITPSDMFITKAKSIFNKAQIQHRMRQLMLLKNQGKEEHFRKFVELNWNNNKVEVTYIPPKDAIVIDGFYESQGSNATKNKKKDTDTHIIIYEEPEYGKDDLYFVSCDPYVVDDKESGESLGSIFILKNPKYISEGKTGNIIVAELTGKPDSRIDFYNKLELLLAYYGNPKRSLMFEGNRGYDLIVEFFKKKGKESLLAFSPGNLDGKWKTSIAQRYGYIVGQNKLELLNKLKDWLEESTTLNVDGIKLNVERISSLGLLSELLNYDYEDDKNKKSNYDRIMSMLGCIVALRNNVNQYEEKILNADDNIYAAFKNKKLKYKTKSKAWITS